MSKESLEHLNTQTLIGFVAKRGRAWHWRAGLQGAESNHYDGPVPVADLRRRLFNWQPLELPISVEIPTDVATATTISGEGMPIIYQRIPGRKAITRSDNHHVMGVFSDSYAPHPADKFLVDYVEKLLDGNVDISAGGLLRQGAQAWIEISVPDNIRTPEGVEFRPNLLAVTSFDGSLATTYKRTITNTVCDNTMAIALREKGSQLKFKHSRNSTARIADAQAALDIVHSAANDFSAQVAQLTNQRVTEAEWAAVVEKLVPVDADATSTRGATLAAQKRGQLNQLYFHDDRVAPWKDTAYGAVMAWNTWGQHLRPTKGTTDRFERNQFEAISGALDASDQLVLDAIMGMDFGKDLVLAPLS